MLNSPLWWFSELFAAGRHRQCTQTSEVAWFSVCILYYSTDWFIQKNGTTVVAVPKYPLSLLLFWTVLRILKFFLQFALAISGAIIGKILLKHSRNRLQASLQNSAPKERGIGDTITDHRLLLLYYRAAELAHTWKCFGHAGGDRNKVAALNLSTRSLLGVCLWLSMY